MYINQYGSIKISQIRPNEQNRLDDTDDRAAVPVSELLVSHAQRACIEFSLPEAYGDGDSGPDPGAYFVLKRDRILEQPGAHNRIPAVYDALLWRLPPGYTRH